MKQSINEIKRMQQLAGIITESEYQESLPKGSNFSSSKLIDTLKQYYSKYSSTSINDPLPYIRFEFHVTSDNPDNDKEANEFEEFLLSSMLTFKRREKNEDGFLTTIFDVNKKQIKQQLGL
jgi:hypothetical protein